MAMDEAHSLNPTEKVVLERLAQDLHVDLAEGESDLDVSRGAEWGPERRIRGSFLAAVCAGDIGSTGRRGVRIRGAHIFGDLDLEFAEITHPVALRECYVDGDLMLSYVRMPALSLTGSRVRSISAQGLETKGTLQLDDGFVSSGTVLLKDASVGALDCSGGLFSDDGGNPLIADRLVAANGIFLDRGFVAQGEVSLQGVHTSELNCAAGTFNNPGGNALNADGIVVERGVFLSTAFDARGEVRMLLAKVAEINCTGGSFSNPRRDALSLDRTIVTGGIFMKKGFSAEGTVRMPNVHIGAALTCTGGEFTNEAGVALMADSLEARVVFLDEGFSARGEVRLLAARIGAQITCRGGTILNPSGDALSLDRAVIEGGLFLDGDFDISGVVRLVGTTIVGQLACRGGTFIGPKGVSINARQVCVNGDAWLDAGFRATGTVDLRGASVTGRFDTFLGKFEGKDALIAERMRVTEALRWEPMPRPEGRVDLGDVRVGELADDIDSWPSRPERLNLEGLVYETLGPKDDFRRRLAWLTKYCSGSRYRPQPYEQAAAVYRRDGRDSDARTVLVTREHARRATLPRPLRPLHWLFGFVVGYGHRLWRPIVPLALLVCVTSFQFEDAHDGCRGDYAAESCSMVITNEEVSSSDFHPVVYSIDAALPVVDLDQQDLWVPQGKYRLWFWLLIVTGWLLTTAVVAGLTRVLARS